MKTNIKIAITGGIGSGKSVITDYLQQLGYPVIKADELGKELMATEESVKKKIIKAFGEESYTGNNPNTKFLAANVFNNKENIERINSIIHPPVMKKINGLLNELFKKNKIVFVESALVFEAKIQKMFDFIILIYSDENMRIERTKKRDKISESEIRKRMAFQIQDEIKKERAHFVIENNSTIEELKQKTSFVINLISKINS